MFYPMAPRRRAEEFAVLWLRLKLSAYLIVFWSRRNRPKAGKDSQKDGGGKYAPVPFTIGVFTMMAA
ncbi:MAG: hypothetical protein ACLPX9_05680 [Rhodomicrobium sp.]